MNDAVKSRQRTDRWKRRGTRYDAIRWLGAAFLVLAGGSAYADTEPSQFQFFLENDILARTDRYYTNGVKFGYGRPGKADDDMAAGRLLGLLTHNEDSSQKGWFLGQNMYTPKNISIATPQPNDRPWGAWLYLGQVAQRATTTDGRKDSPVQRIDTVEIDVGVTGPAALGEEVQKAVHRRTGSRTPMGWDNQARTEPGVSMALLSKWKLAGNDYVDLISHAGATAGTVMTLGRVGGIVRFGYGLSGFGIDTVEPGGAILQSTLDRHADIQRKPFEFYGFAGVDQRLVLRNAFLDGPVFHDGPSVKRRPHVYDLLAGVSLRLGVVRFSVTRVQRSEEFYTATGGGGRQAFHSFNIGAEW